MSELFSYTYNVAFSYIFEVKVVAVKVGGIVGREYTLEKLHPLKARSPIDFTDLGIVIEANPLNPLQRLAGICSTEFPKEKDVMFDDASVNIGCDKSGQEMEFQITVDNCEHPPNMLSPLHLLQS